MEEQKFIDLLFMIKITRNDGVNIGAIITKITRENGLPFTNCLEIKDSTIHGKGVFAKTDIPSGTVVGIYPYHGRIEGRKYFVTDDYLKYVGTEEVGFEDYKIHIGNKKFIFGIPSIQEDYLVGHLINDSYPYVNDVESVNDIDKYSKLFEKYTMYSLSNNNCKFITYDDLIYVKTIKPIKSGEELLTSYDFNYWCKSLTPDSCEKMFEKYFSSLTGKKKQYICDIYKKKNTESQPLKPSEEIMKKVPLLLNLKRNMTMNMLS